MLTSRIRAHFIQLFSSKKRLKVFLAASAVLVTLHFTFSSGPTASGQQLTNAEGMKYPNDWMKIPVDWVPSTDRVPTSTRKSRDTYFDGLIGFSERLTPQNAKTRGYSGDHFGRQTEIPKIPNRAIAIGTLSQYQPVLSASGRSIYTEATFAVSKFIETSPGAKDGPLITVILVGGTVRPESGEIISFLTSAPQAYFVEVGKQYLLVMSYDTTGDFYTLDKSWDVSSGRAQPNFATRSTPQSLVGVSIGELPTRVASLIEAK